MNIVVTGSIGHISLPLTKELVKKGHSVTVVSSKPEKQNDIEALGARAAVGALEDVDFLTATFSGADAVYCMIPPNNYFDHNLDLTAYYMRIATNYAQAVQQSGVGRVVYLSSIGAHLAEGSGILVGHYKGEAIMNTLADVAITFMRPLGFHYNLFGFVPMIRSQGVMAANYGADDVIPYVSPLDIAAAIVKELEGEPTHRKVQYIVSEEITGNDVARILGEAIGKPDLKWVIIPDEQMLGSLKAAGMNPRIAAGLVEMYASQHSGLLEEDYYRNKPAVIGNVKMTDFAKEFAAAFL
jgi:uncharacterized protein YbjT (DUF2867 family)